MNVRWGLPLHVYYETSLVIIALVLAGKWMEGRAKKRTAVAVTALVGLAPRTARVVRVDVELYGTERVATVLQHHADEGPDDIAEPWSPT